MISLSFSAAQKYLSSPFAYFAHYFLRLRTVGTGSALVFGSALDEAFNHLLECKRDGKDIDVTGAKLAFSESFNKFDANSIKYSKADLDEAILTPHDLDRKDKPLAWISLHKKGHILIDEYVAQVMPKIEKVILVQHKIEVKNADGDTLTGVVDLVAQIGGKTYIVDNKTASKAYVPNAANESPQLATYFEALRHEYNLDGVAFIVVPKNLRKKKLPVVDISFIYGEAGEELIEKTFAEYDAVLHGIRNGQFPCTPDKCCANFWGCDYASYCRSGGKDMTGLMVAEKK